MSQCTLYSEFYDVLCYFCVKVDRVEMYNPLSVSSGLFESLQFQLMRNVPGRRKAAATAQVHVHYAQRCSHNKKVLSAWSESCHLPSVSR